MINANADKIRTDINVKSFLTILNKISIRLSPDKNVYLIASFVFSNKISPSLTDEINSS